MGRAVKWVAIGVVAILAVSYMVFATDYQGKYNVDIAFTVSSETAGEVDILDFSATFEEMDALSMFDQLRTPSKTSLYGPYQVFVEFNQSGEVETLDQLISTTISEPTYGVVFDFTEKNPGEANIRIYVVYEISNSIIFDKTYPVVVG